jgi:hypothetical protein
MLRRATDAPQPLTGKVSRRAFRYCPSSAVYANYFIFREISTAMPRNISDTATRSTAVTISMLQLS